MEILNVEEEYLDILQNIEFAIMSVYRDNPLLVDFDVEAAINALISLYHAESQNHEPRPARPERACDAGLSSGSRPCATGGSAARSFSRRICGSEDHSRNLSRWM